MLKQLDLDDVAQAFLSVRTPDRPEYERLLLRAREKAVRPLLTVLLTEAAKQRHNIQEILLDLEPFSLDNSFARYLLTKSVFESIVEQVASVIARLGQPAKIELCHALLDCNEQIALTAALLLAMDQSPSVAIRDEIQKMLIQMKRSPAPDLVFMVLGVTLMRAGDIKWKQVIEQHARSLNISTSEWIERTIDTAMIEVFLEQ